MRIFRGRCTPESYSELCELWENYYKINKKYPNSVICQTDKSLPSWSKVKSLCGDKFNDFIIRYKEKDIPDINKYEEYINSILELSNKLNRTPSVKDLRSSDTFIPDYRWLIKNSNDDSVNSLNSLMSSINLKPSYNISKEQAINLVLAKKQNLDRNLKSSDFDNPNKDEIGHGTIKKIWGNFNNMILDLGLEINQIGRSRLEKDIKILCEELNEFCKDLSLKENRKVITVDDVNSSVKIQNWGTYDRRLRKELNITMVEYLNSIGFETNVAGMGTVTKHDDGEITTSLFEYNFSNFLKENNIKYQRNVKYKYFINNYLKNKDCDYVLEIDGEKVYVEIAGMLSDYKNINHAKSCKLSKIHSKYLLDLMEKEELLKSNNCKYIIIFPKDLEVIMSNHAEAKNNIFGTGE